MPTDYVRALFRYVDSGSKATAFELGDRELSWSQLETLSRRYAAGLQSLGFEKGDRIAVMLETSLELMVALVGHYRLGLVHVPVNTGYGPVEISHILADSGARAVVVDDDTPAHSLLDELDMPATLERRIVVGGEREGAEVGFGQLCEHDPIEGPPVVDDDDRSIFIYTSGTTGASKGVEHTFRSVLSDIDNLTKLWQWSEADRQVLALPLFHVHGLGIGVHGTLLRGCSTQLFETFDARKVAHAIGEGGTIFMGVPTMHTRLVRAMEDDPALADELSGARLFTSGSAALRVDIFERFEELTGHAILERYGMSETMLTLSNPYEGERRPGTVGFPVPGCEVRVVDEDFQDLEPGAEDKHGQIVVRGPTLMQGYWNQPELTEEAFHDGWFLTGDVATVDEDGYIAIVGRESVDIIMSGGYKISAREIEQVIQQDPHVSEIAIVGVPDTEWGERIAAAVVPTERTGDTVEKDILLARLAERVEASLASYKKPRELIIVNELPRNALGKIQKHRIIEDFRARE